MYTEFESKLNEKVYHANNNLNKAIVAILILHKVRVILKKTRERKEYYIMIKESIHPTKMA